MESREKYIADHYAGDVSSFEQDWADSITRARRYVVDWKDLSLNAAVLPELEMNVHDLIEQYLGYLPHQSVTIEFEPYLRALVQRHRAKDISEDDFKNQATEHIKLIRNKDMEFHTCVKYDVSIFDAYETNNSPYKQIIRDRLTRLLGYRPDLHHSVVAELWMQKILSIDTITLPSEPTSIDLKAITLIKYREVLTEYGEIEAQSSNLVSSIQ